MQLTDEDVSDLALLRLAALINSKDDELEDEEFLNQVVDQLETPDDQQRQLYSNPRVGRFLGRSRRSADDDVTGPLGDGSRVVFPRLGMYARQTPHPRLGMLLLERSLNDIDEGKDDYQRALPRFGMRSIDAQKRAMGMLRMGKKEDQMRMIRGMSMLRMGKRGSMSMLRMGRSAAEESGQANGLENSKRAGMSMLRMGKRDNEEPDEESEARANTLADKKNMSMLRMGKRSDSISN